MGPGIKSKFPLLDNIKQEICFDYDDEEATTNDYWNNNLIKIENEEIQDVKFDFEVQTPKSSPESISNEIKTKSSKLPCDFCLQSARKYRNYKELQRHVERHHNTEKYALKCDFCGSMIMQKICLIAHMHKYHLAKNDNECPDCHKKFDAYIKLRRHLRVHYKSIHRCDICHKIFENRMELREHFDHHLARKQGIKCYFRGCNQFFGSVKKANSHYKKHTSMVICPLCGKTCSDKGVLTSHLARHEANGDSRQNMYQCDLCTHKFEEKSWLEIHMNYKHLQSNEYKCPVCQDKFPTHSRLIIHVKRHTMQFKCDICEKEFSQQSGLITHRKFHFSTDIFECDFPNCNKSYNRKECLSRHKLNHENVKRHKCQICGMKFVLKQ